MFSTSSIFFLCVSVVLVCPGKSEELNKRKMEKFGTFWFDLMITLLMNGFMAIDEKTICSFELMSVLGSADNGLASFKGKIQH